MVGPSQWLLTDFECADRIGERLFTRYRDQLYVPPEVVVDEKGDGSDDSDDGSDNGSADVYGKPYGIAGDIYCLGVVLREWEEGSRYYEDGDKLSLAGRDLLQSMLCPSPEDRPSAESALANPWFQE